MSTRPPFVDTLLSRPLPALTPPGLGNKYNPPYSKPVGNEIADLKCHPLLESCLHLMNDDLFSAHFLLRKMQEDGYGKWLHAILHQTEGDLEKNAKLWYEQIPTDLLSHFWAPPRFIESDPVKAAHANMYRIMRVKGGEAKEGEEEEARQIKWDELCFILKELEGKFGWKAMAGREAYTKDEDPSHKSMVLGEGWRTWDKAGRSDR